MSKKINLTKGMVAIVDDDDYGWLSKWSWCFQGRYAVRGNSGGERFYMHRAINKTPEGMDTDHVNHNTLDNRRKNLRTVTTQQNRWNNRMPKHNTSGFMGVCWDKDRNKWTAKLGLMGKCIHLGRYVNKLDAIKARKIAEEKYHVGI